MTGLMVDAAIDSYRFSLRADTRNRRRSGTCVAALAQFSRFLAERGIPRTLRAIRREHVEAFGVSLHP